MTFGSGLFSVDRQLWVKTRPIVWYSVVLMNLGALMYGYDTSMFGALQVTPSWLRTFGTLNTKTGKYSISTEQKAILNSTVWAGKITGVFIAAPLNHRLGYKWSILIACCSQAIGVIVEMATSDWRVFCAGRTIVYLAVGHVENVTPLYVGEIVNPNYRAFFVSTFSMMVAIGGLWANAAVKQISTYQDRSGWLIATGQQFAPMAVLMAGVYFCPDSPRWLIQKGRTQDAENTIRRLRTSEDDEQGWVQLECRAIQEAVEAESHLVSDQWIECFKGTNLRRTIIACMVFIANQWTGNQFVIAYAPTLYVMLGRQSQAYTYTILRSVMCVVSMCIAMLMFDKAGRRPIVIYGSFLQAFFLLLMGGLASKAEPSYNDLNMIVACILLFKFFAEASANALAYVIAAETSSLTLRRKTMAIGCAVDVVAAFVVTFSSPYLMNAIGAKLGFVFGGYTFLLGVWAVFFLPELKGRSLEEIDELFNARLWAWQFSSYETKGLGRVIAQHESSNREPDDAAAKRDVTGDVEEGREDEKAVEVTQVERL